MSSEFSLKDLVPFNSQEKTEPLNESPTSRRLDSAWLVYLNASNSKIVLLDFLVNLPNIEVLILQHNLIESLEYVWLCKNLFHLDVSHNKIKSIESVGRFAALGQLNLVGNKITWTELERIHHMQIIDANFSGNRELEKDIAYYRLHIIDCLPYLWSLDGRLITALERSRVKDFFQQSEMSSKPIRHKLSGLIFKQTNSHNGEVLSARAIQFLRHFNITVTHTSQLDEQRLLFAADQLCEDLATLSTPTWVAVPSLPQTLVSFPRIIVDAINLAKVDIGFGVDLLSSLITSLLFDLPADLIPFIVTLPNAAAIVNRDITSVAEFFNIPGALRLRLASLLLTRVELDYADHDRSRGVIEVVLDSAFFGIASHILLSFLKAAPTDPRLIVSDESFFPKTPAAGLRQCSALFGARTLFKFLKSIFSTAQEQGEDEAFANFVVRGASLLSSEVMTPIVTLVKDDEIFRSANLTGRLLSPSGTEIKFFEQSASKEKGVDEKAEPSSPAEQSAVATLARELHDLYTELINRIPFFYDAAAQAVSESASKVGSAGVRTTPIGSAHALLARPPPTPLRCRDALSVGQHVPPSGPPALRPRPPPKRPKIGDVVLVAIQHTGRIIAVPDQSTVCVQLDVVPDKVGLHPPGSHPFLPSVTLRVSSATTSVKKAAPTLSSEYSYMYFNIVDLKWDAVNSIWRSHISNTNVTTGRLYLNRASASSPTPEGQCQRRTGTSNSPPGTLMLDVNVDSAVNMRPNVTVKADEVIEDHTLLKTTQGEPETANIETTSISSFQKESYSSTSGTISPAVFLRHDLLFNALKLGRKMARQTSAPTVVSFMGSFDPRPFSHLSSVLRGRVFRSADSFSRRARFEQRCKWRRAVALLDYGHPAKSENFLHANVRFTNNQPKFLNKILSFGIEIV